MNHMQSTDRSCRLGMRIALLLSLVMVFALALGATALAAEDGLAPTTTASPAPTGTFHNSVTFSLTATDGAGNSGVAHLYYAVDGGSLTTVNGASASVPFNTIGSHSLRYFSQDASGNTEATHDASFAVDDTIKPVTIAPDWVPNYDGPAIIHLFVTDASPVTTYYQVDSDAVTTGTVVTVNTSGDHTLTFWSVDSASNTETQTVVAFSVNIVDTTPPVTTSDAAGPYADSATIHLTATDELGGSGVAHTYWKVDSAAAYTEGTVATVTGVSAGSHTLSFYSVDVAGNTESVKTAPFTMTITVVPDTIAPVTSSDAVATYTPGPAVIHLTATDAGSGIGAMFYTVDGGAVTTVTVPAAARHAASIPAIASFTVPSTTGPGAGSHGGVAGQTGASGNCFCHGAVSSTIASIAASAVVPAGHFEAIPSTPCNNCHVVKAPVVITTPPGPPSYSTTVTVTGNGAHVLTFWSTDASGNVETHKVADFAIAPPTPTRTTVRLSKSPGGTKYTITRRRGVASFAYSARLETLTGVSCGAGKTAQLLKSADGVNWGRVRCAAQTTDADGWVHVSLVFKTAGNGYWKWIFDGDSQYYATSTSKSLIVVR